jgi:hypothetical protein
MDLIRGYTPFLAAGGLYCFVNLASMVETWNKGIEHHIWEGKRYFYDSKSFEEENENEIKESYKGGLGSFLDAEIGRPGRKAGYAALRLSYFLIENLSGSERMSRIIKIREKRFKNENIKGELKK